jgi:uncharacterized protein (DUF2345 family)
MEYGIIENNDDSTHPDGYKLGRCQVRIFGKHTNNKLNIDDFEYLPTSELPWFDVMIPATSAGIQVNYETPFLKNGSTAYVEYTDKDQQYGVIIGVLLRQPNVMSDFNKGFSDPTQKYPLNEDLHRSPLYPYATGEINDVVQYKKGHLTTSVLGFTEPATPYDPTYTHNKVISSKNHFIEFDETPGKERVHIYHKSGTFSEIHPSGTKVTNVKGSQYHIVIVDDNTKVDGKYNLDVIGNIQVKTLANETTTVGINSSLIVGNDTVLSAGGDTTITAGGDIVTSAAIDNSVLADAKLNLTSGNNTTINSGKNILGEAADYIRLVAKGITITNRAGTTIMTVGEDGVYHLTTRDGMILESLANMDIISTGTTNITSIGTTTIDSSGNAIIKSAGSTDIIALTDATITATKDATITATENAIITSGINTTITASTDAKIEAGGNTLIKSGGNTTIESTGDAIVTATNVDITASVACDVLANTASIQNPNSTGEISMETDGTVHINNQSYIPKSLG